MSENSALSNEQQSSAGHSIAKAGCDCRHDVSPNAEKPGHQIGVVSFLFAERFYYLVLIEGGTRDAVSFRGISAKRTTTDGLESKILNFHIEGPLIEMAADLGDFHKVEISGEVWSEAPDKAYAQISATGHILLTPLRSCDGLSPHGALFWLESLNKPTIQITLSGFREGKKRPAVAAVLLAITSLLQALHPVLQDIIKVEDTISKIGANTSFHMTADKQDGKITLDADAYVGPGTMPISIQGD